MNENEIIHIQDKYMANIYSKKPIVLSKGKKALVWDLNGNEYIDCMGAYGVCIIGHCHPKVVDSIRKQSETLLSCHGSLYNPIRSQLLKKIVAITPKKLDKVFLSNSGTEAVEAAIKLARKYTGKSEIIAFMGAYHGKTMGALSATWNKKYRDPYKPLVPSFKHVPYGNYERVRGAISNNTAAIIVEPIQGEGGIKVPPKEFLSALRELCDDKNILLICDEVQTGFGRTGKLFAFEHYGIIPDILCLAKSIAGGVPMGATVARNDVMSSFKIGDHSSTFGGNPLACAAACATIEVIIEEKLSERAEINGNYFIGKLEALREKYKLIREVRGLGLMIGMEFRFDVLNLILGSMKQGILVLDAGRNILRFLPPLVITKEQIDTVVNVLDTVIMEDENEKLCRQSSN
ncbi:MAG: aspartate aminotransferase family protein [Candidatus Bathyarchaeota archaeon]|nr:MAG: aspartate aminotransferase family protein [Candidatus Bathyarchaeota archaeon]